MARLYRVIQPVRDIETATRFYTHVLGLEGERVREAGGQVDGPIEMMSWGERMFYARDPFGNPISFVDETTTFHGTSRERR